MQQVHVYLGLNEKPEINVEPHVLAAHKGEEIVWQVHSLDKQVTHVQIEFEKDDDKFFPCRDSGNPKKDCYTLLNRQEGSLHGKAPALGEPGARQGKYVVRAYAGIPDKGGKLLYDVDPDIVTVDP